MVSADLTGLEHALEKRQGTNGTISILHFEIGVRFGGTQLEAFLQWDENVSRPSFMFCFEREGDDGNADLGCRF